MRKLPKDYQAFILRQFYISERPSDMPVGSAGKIVICEFSQVCEIPPLNLTLICESVADIQTLYDVSRQARTVKLKWYLCDILINLSTLEMWETNQARQALN